MQKDFIVNGHFLIQPSTNLFTDIQLNSTVRLEPRLMQLLCILAAETGHTLPREEMVKSIWHNYGGGDEGLTQGISALRKVFEDHNRELIKTIPKKGYQFTGSIKAAPNANAKPESAGSTNKSGGKMTLPGLLLAAVLIACGIYFLSGLYNDPTIIGYPTDTASLKLNEENANNTITTKSKDDTRYKLVMIGDRPPKFYVNDTLVPEGKWAAHMPLINYLKFRLGEKRKRL